MTKAKVTELRATVEGWRDKEADTAKGQRALGDYVGYGVFCASRDAFQRVLDLLDGMEADN